MSFLAGRKAQGTVEWLVVAAILVAVVGAVLLSLFETLRDRLQAVSDAL